MKTLTPSCAELYRQIVADNPGVRLARSRQENAIGAWSERLGRFQMVVSATIDGRWVKCDYECLINGEPPYADSDWLES